MFVRFRQSPRRLQLSLVETRREGGRVRHEHVASLGALPLGANLGDRAEFWRRLFERLERLANRLDDEIRTKIVDVVLARVPMPTQEETRTHFERRATVWEMLHIRTTATVEENKVVREAADKMIAVAEPLAVMAQSELQEIAVQRARMARGEGIPPIGWIPSPKDLGITAAHAAYMIQLSLLPPEQFERFLNFGRRSVDIQRRDYARLRRFLRAEARRQRAQSCPTA